MSFERALQVPCPCGANIDAVLPLTLDLDDADTLHRVARGDVNVVRCGACGKPSGVVLDITARSARRDAIFQVVHDEHRVADVRAMLQHATGAHIRIVANRAELSEKVRLMLSGIDDVAFEVVRCLAMAATGDRDNRFERWFARIEDDEIHFMILERGAPCGSYKCPVQVLRNVEAKFETARYRNELEVDHRLAARLMRS